MQASSSSFTWVAPGALLIPLIIAHLLTGCGGSAPPAAPPVLNETPEDEILAVGTSWEARSSNSGIRSAPSKISVFKVEELLTVEFTAGSKTARQTVLREEKFQMLDGSRFSCRSDATVDVAVRFFSKGDEPAVELSYPPVQFARNCDKPGFPEPTFGYDLPRSSFLLRDERLIGFDPPLEEHSYIPVQ